jgi:hypothetical protein
MAWGAPSDAACIDLDEDAANCGSCDHACAVGERCVDGACCAGRELACTTGGDLDCDGRTACDDCDCWSTGLCGFADPGVELDCTNGVSDDFDVLVDCADSDCATARPCGGPGRCPSMDLGAALPVSRLVNFAPIASDLDGSCDGSDQPEVTVRWTAPHAGTFTFAVGGPSPRHPSVQVRDAACDGAVLGCGAGHVSVDLAMGQVVVLVLEGVGATCHELSIR